MTGRVTTLLTALLAAAACCCQSIAARAGSPVYSGTLPRAFRIGLYRLQPADTTVRHRTRRDRAA